MWGRTTVIAIIFLVGIITSAHAYSYERGENAEPAFLRDIGPQEDRADNPTAAAVTALAVIAIFYRGFKEYGPDPGSDTE